MTTSTVEQLLAHAPLVRRLALHLARDPDAAADVEQETWAVAATRAEAPRNPAAWLGAVVRNAVRTRARAARSRRFHEHRAARAEALPDTSVERAEGQRWLAEELLALPDEQRRVLVMRYLDERPPRAIARELGVSVATVQGRLRRAKEQLRARLDRRFGDRGAWVAALATQPAALLPARGLAIAAAALLVGAGTWVTVEWSADGRGRGGDELAAATLDPGDMPDEGDAPIEARPSQDARKDASQDPDPPPYVPPPTGTRPLDVRVVDAAGKAVEGLPLDLATYASGALGVTQQWTPTDADGHARLTWNLGRTDRRGMVHLNVPVISETPVGMAFVPEAWPEEAVTLTLPPLATVEVVVIGPDGRPDAGASGMVWFTPGPAERPNYSAGNVVRRLVDGRIAWPWVASSATLCVRLALDGDANLGSLSDFDPVTVAGLAPGEVRRVEIRPEHGRSVGVALHTGGAPLTGTEVAVTLHATRHDRPWRYEGTAVTDAGGRLLVRYGEAVFEHGGLVALEVRHAGERMGFARLDLPPRPAPGRLDLGVVRLEALPPLAHGRLVDEAGAPILRGYARLQCTSDGERWYTPQQRWQQHVRDGSFRFDGRPEDFPEYERFRVHVTAGGFFEGFSEEFEAAGDVVVTLRRSLEQDFTVHLPEGARESDVRYYLTKDGEHVSASFGRGVIRGVEAGTYDLQVKVTADPRAPVLRLADVELTGDPGAPPLELDLRDQVELRTVRVSGTDGRAVRRPTIELYDEAEPFDGAFPSRLGAAGDEPFLVPRRARYALVVRAEGYAPRKLAGFDADLDVALDPALVREVLWEQGGYFTLLPVEAWRGSIQGASRSSNGRYEFPGPGTYRLRYFDARAEEPPFVPAGYGARRGLGLSVEVEFDVNAADAAPIVLERPPVRALAKVTVRDETGAPVEATVWSSGEREWFTAGVQVGPGTYELKGFPVQPRPTDELTIDARAPGYEPAREASMVGDEVVITLTPSDR